MNLLGYKVIYFRPNSSRNFNMAAMKTLFVHMIVPINAIYKNVISYYINKMTTYVSSSFVDADVRKKVILLGRSQSRALVVLVFAHDMQTQVAQEVCKQGCHLLSYTANKRLVTIETCYNCPRSPLRTAIVTIVKKRRG